MKTCHVQKNKYLIIPYIAVFQLLHLCTYKSLLEIFLAQVFTWEEITSCDEIAELSDNFAAYGLC